MVSQVRDLGPRTSLLKSPRPHELQQPPGQPQGRGTGKGWRTAACWGAPQNTAAPCTWRPPPRRPATSPRTGGAGQSEARLTQSGEGQTSTSLPPPAPLAPQTGRVRRGWAIRPARVLRGKKHQRRGRRTCSAARPAQTGPQARAPHSRRPEGTSRCRGCPRCARALPPHERPGHTAALGKGPSPGRRRLGDSSLAKGTPTGRALPCPEDSGLWPCRPTLRLISTNLGSTGACQPGTRSGLCLHPQPRATWVTPPPDTWAWTRDDPRAPGSVPVAGGPSEAASVPYPEEAGGFGEAGRLSQHLAA